MTVKEYYRNIADERLEQLKEKHINQQQYIEAVAKSKGLSVYEYLLINISGQFAQLTHCEDCNDYLRLDGKHHNKLKQCDSGYFIKKSALKHFA